MSNKVVLLVAFLCLITFSCKDNTNVLMEEVMTIHDEVMPKMSDLGKLVSELRTKMDASENGEQYQKAMVDLQQANTAMMDWMKGFGDKFDPDEILNGKKLTPEKIKTLLEEKIKIKEVKAQINNGIINAKKVLEKDE